MMAHHTVLLLVLVLVATAAVAQNTTDVAQNQTQTVFIQPNITGVWYKPCSVVEIGGQESGIEILYNFTADGYFTYNFNSYNNVDMDTPGYCGAPTPDLSFFFTGTYELEEPLLEYDLEIEPGGDGNSSVAQLILIYETKELTIYNSGILFVLQLACPTLYQEIQASHNPNYPLVYPHVVTDAFTWGCLAIGVGNLTACPIEYDIIATFDYGQEIAIGDRTQAGLTAPLVPCTVAESPISLGYVLGGFFTPTPIATATPTVVASPTPTSVPTTSGSAPTGSTSTNPTVSTTPTSTQKAQHSTATSAHEAIATITMLIVSIILLAISVV